MAYSGHSEPKWPLLYLFSNNYDLFCESYSIKFNWLYEKNTVNADMTHQINEFFVIIAHFLCCKKQTKYKNTIHIVDSSIEMHEKIQEINPGQSVVVKILWGQMEGNPLPCC